MHHALKKEIRDLTLLCEKLYRAPASYFYAIPVTVQEVPQPTYTNNETQHKQTCQHHEGAMLVAEYIVQEIKTNVKSEIAKAIRWINTNQINIPEVILQFPSLPNLAMLGIKQATALSVTSTLWFFKVKTGADWDHKRLIRDKFRHVAVKRKTDRGIDSETLYHKYKQYDFYYDVWSNIHYGYVGLSIGFSEDYLLLGASLEQLRTTALGQLDPIDDVTSIKIGFELYKEFGKYADSLKTQDILNKLYTVSHEKLSKSRVAHWCWNVNNTKRIRDNY